MNRIRIQFSYLLGLLLFISACAGEMQKASPSLYDRLGGVKAIQYVTEQVCMATGGPCTYTGRNMNEAHAGLGITEAELNYVVEDLVTTLNEYKVPKQEQNEVLALVAPMKPDIVEKPYIKGCIHA